MHDSREAYCEAKQLIAELSPDYLREHPSNVEQIARRFVRSAGLEGIRRIRSQLDCYTENGARGAQPRDCAETNSRGRYDHKRSIVKHILEETGIDLPLSPNIPSGFYEDAAQHLAAMKRG